MNIVKVIEQYVDAAWKKSTGENILVRCPFHKGGQEAHPSCSVHTTKHVFKCFTCHEKGHIGKLLAKKRVPEEITSALTTRRTFRLPEIGDPFKADPLLPEHLLASYRYHAKPWIDEGFDRDHLQYFEIGMDVRNHRVTIPIRDIYGNLMAIMGRNTRGSIKNKYVTYKKELGEFCPAGYSPKIHNILWRYFMLSRSDEPIVIVEGFKAAIWVSQCGILDVVACMTSQLSDKQIQLLARQGRPVVLYLDNDSAGAYGTRAALSALRKVGIETRIANYAVLSEFGAHNSADDLPQHAVLRGLTEHISKQEWIEWVTSVGPRTAR